MSKLTLGAAIVMAVCATASANAADLPYRQPAQPYPYATNQPLNVFNWAGFYVGGNLGYGWGNVDNARPKPSGLNGGAVAGYNWQSGQLVFGLEGDIDASGASDTFAPWKFSNPWFGTARGRVGYAVNNFLLYGTGGLAFGELTGETFGLSESHTSLGWTVGAGAEVGLTKNWTAKVEYLYLDLANHTFTVTGVPNGLQLNTLRIGANYHF